MSILDTTLKKVSSALENARRVSRNAKTSTLKTAPRPAAAGLPAQVAADRLRNAFGSDGLAPKVLTLSDMATRAANVFNVFHNFTVRQIVHETSPS